MRSIRNQSGNVTGNHPRMLVGEAEDWLFEQAFVKACGALDSGP
jgi:hypothetical protein